MKRDPAFFNEKRLRDMMQKNNVDAVILRGNENSKYVSEFFNNGGQLAYRPFTVFYFLDPALPPAFIVPAVDLHLAMDSTWIEDVRAYAMAEFFTDLDVHFYADFFEAAAAVLAERKVKGMVIGTEGEALPAGFKARMDALLEGNRLVDIGPAMEVVRMVKTPEEIRRLRLATDITVKAHAAFRAAIRIGATDHDLFRAATGAMIENGADGIKFINIGCGPQTSYAAHAPFPIGHAIRRGDFVKVDMGASCLGYGGDFVRSYFVGEASERQREIWQRLNEVQVELGLSLRPGVTGGEIFDRGYEKISQYLPRFPREFVGHGIGLGSHEQPRMNQVNRTVLEPNTVFCIEYSYYHDGVRHHTEDTFLVTENDVEFWTEGCPRDLIVPA
ncbi:MAG TPA: Xaa-Pro peptidase family protein [Geminicoccaceae bacterium]|nr:Xaa-Pro peptidase family protein [Geminicoccaceae bacterium]